MRFQDTDVMGALTVEVERIEDERGYFGRIWCEREFADAGFSLPWRQANTGFSHRAGTLRGMHFQRAPDSDAKLVRCVRGTIYDVALDLRPESETYKRWTGAELSAQNGTMLLIPEGCAHGYLTLQDESEIIYLTTAFYASESASGVLWNDTAFGIEWPAPPSVISEQDRSWPHWTDAREGSPT
jgi:dTDP-4-dehydrorhamnose 3,5-epimerase